MSAAPRDGLDPTMGQLPIEFAEVADVTGTDEDLAERPPPAWLRTPRRRTFAALALAAVVLAGVGVRLASRPHHPSAAGSAASAANPPAGVPAPVAASPTRYRLAHPRGLPADLTRCPQSASCAILSTLPAAVLAAVQDRLPGADVAYQLDVTRTDIPAVQFRQLDVGYGTNDLVITVFPFRAGMPRSATDSMVYASGGTVGFVWEVADGYAIQVQFSGPLGWRPTLSDLHRLAADPRLRAPG